MKTGAALVMVLLSLALVAALSVGGAFVTRRYEADARIYQSASRVVPSLEEALVTAAGTLDTAYLRSIPLGASAQLGIPVTSGASPVVIKAWVSRLNSETFSLVGEAASAHKPLLIKRLRLVVTVDSTAVRPLPNGGWTLLP